MPLQLTVGYLEEPRFGGITASRRPSLLRPIGYAKAQSCARLFLIHTLLFPGRRLRSNILASSRLVRVKNTHACYPFKVLQDPYRVAIPQ